MLSIPIMSRYLLALVLFTFALSGTLSFAGGETTLQEAYPTMGFGVLRFAKLSDLPKGTVLRVEDIVFDESQLLRMIDKESREAREELKKNLIFVLEPELENKLLLAEAYANGYSKEIPEEQTILSFKTSKIPAVSVSDEEAKAFYEENSAVLGNLPFDQVADAVKDYLAGQKRELILEAYLLELAKSKNIRIQSSWARENCALARDNPVDQARSSGKPTLVEFGATGCTACDLMQPILSKLKEKFFSKINVVFIHIRHYPNLAFRYKINLIPVQAFFDKTGKEVFRHMGFFPQNEIEKKLAEMGVN
jgi:thioredoxin 1